MNPKRYDCGTLYDGGVMEEAPNGEFVAYADYEALAGEVRELREVLSTPLLTGADAPMYGGIFGAPGVNRDVAETAFYAGAPCVTVYCGVTRVFTSVAEFCAAYPKEAA